MGFQKRTWLLVLFLLSLVGVIAFQIIHISQTEKLYPTSILQKGYEIKTENLYPIQYLRGKYGYVNQAAQMVVEPQFDYANEFSEGFAPVQINKKWGFINLQGQISISPQYEMVGESSSPYSDDYERSSSSFSEGLAGVKLNGKWGFINQSNELVIPYQYDKVQQFSGGVTTVEVNGLWGVINPEGKWMIQPVDKSFIQFFQGIAKLDLISVNESKQLIGDPNIYWDKSGRLVGDFYNPPKLAKEFQEELAIIEIPLRAKRQGQDVSPVVATSEYQFLSWNKCGFQDKQGKVVIKLQFDGCRSFSQGLAAVLVDKKWGYIDKTGKFIISPQFDYADSLFEERALVVSNGKIGFIDKTGKVAVKLEFDPNLGSLSSPNTTAEVELLRSKFKKHAQQLAPSDVARYRFSNGLAVVGKNDKCGYIDETGKFAIQPQFIGCERLDPHGVAKVIRQSRFGQKNWNESLYINSEGKIFPQQIIPDSLSKFYPARIKLLTSVMACLLWIVAISFHEFGHAIVTSWGGDRSVKDKGYLSLNPRRYSNPLHSIILPALAGPIANILFGLLLVPIFHFSLAWNLPHWFSAFIVVFINLQFIIALLNLLPISPLDGYRIITVWLLSRLQNRSGIASLIGLFFTCSIFALLHLVPAAVTLGLGISEEFSQIAWYLFDIWYTALSLLVASLIYLIYKPAVIFQLIGLVLEKSSPISAIKNYDKAIKLAPKSAWSWERKAWTLSKLENLRDSVETISAFEKAIKLHPLNRYNRFLWQALIANLMLSFLRDGSHEQLIEVLEKYTEFHPKDGWGWGAKALTLDNIGNDEEALLAWEKNIKLDPSDPYKWRSQMKESTLERLRSLNKL